MVPTDYRLDHVVARLIERLEGARPTYADDETAAEEDFGRVARDHVEAALGEFREVGLADDAERHAAFLRQEVTNTFLPRYHRVAMDMNEQEAANFGFRAVGDPVGRLGLVVVALLGMFLLFRVIFLPVVWPLFLIDLSLPFWPDIAALVMRRRHRRRLEAIVEDMGRIQDQATHYLSTEQLSAANEPPASAVRRPGTEREGEQP